jgi:thiol:disulfide interchange protein
MTFFGLTMALPFVGLALFPAAAKSLPKSGDWMHTMKVTLGFVLFIAALQFLAKADGAAGWGILTPAVSQAVVSGVSLAAALYLLGLVRLHGETGTIGPLRLAIGVGALVFAIHGLIGAVGTGGPTGGPAGGKAVSWSMVEDDFEGGLARARAEGKPALINWTGVT